MRLSFYFISLFFFILIDISTSSSSIISINLAKKININKNIYLTNNSKICVVDFRNILKESRTMKKLGKEFLKFEKQLNDKIKKEEQILRNKELKLSSNKNKISEKQFNKEKNEIKMEITNLQKFAFAEKRFKFIISINPKKTKRRISVCNKENFKR